MRAVHQSLLVFCILCVGVFLFGLRIGERSSVPPPSHSLRALSPEVLPGQTMVLPPTVITGPSKETSETEILDRSVPGTLRIGSSLSSPIGRERQIRNVFLRETASGQYSVDTLKMEFGPDGHIRSILLDEGSESKTLRRSRFFLVFVHEMSPVLFPELYTEIVERGRYDRCANVTLKHDGKVTGLFVACLYRPPSVIIA